jgi:hypothetical protein
MGLAWVMGAGAMGAVGGDDVFVMAMEPSSSKEGAKIAMELGMPEMGLWMTAAWWTSVMLG